MDTGSVRCRLMWDIRGLRSTDGPLCDRIVARLPYHFGNAEGRRDCALAVRTQDGLVAVYRGDVVGFLTVARHFEESAEISWMAVDPDYRRQGIGRALVERLKKELIAEGRRWLLVLTVSPSDGDDEIPDGYGATRDFYRSVGFSLARDFPDYWSGGDTPVLLVTRLETG